MSLILLKKRGILFSFKEPSQLLVALFWFHYSYDRLFSVYSFILVILFVIALVLPLNVGHNVSTGQLSSGVNVLICPHRGVNVLICCRTVQNSTYFLAVLTPMTWFVFKTYCFIQAGVSKIILFHVKYV